MSLLQLPDSIASENLQIWNNAAFDDGSASKHPTRLPPPPPPPLRPLSTNFCGSPIDLDPSKENRSPAPAKPLVSPKKPAARVAFRGVDADVDDGSIDGEIERIEEEIALLRSRLDALRVRKAERDSSTAADAGRQRGRIVPAKFMEARNPATPASKRIGQSPAAASAGLRRRGMSLGPLEILPTPARPLDSKRAAAKNLWPSALKKKTEESPAPSAKVDRRGFSLGPLEIHESVALDQANKPTEASLRSVQSCKKPSFRKLEDIEEENGAAKESERSLSLKTQPPATTKKTTPDAKKATKDPVNVRLRQRGVSLGPAEIASSARSCRPSNLQQDREKGMKTDKLPRRSSSMSPKSRQPSVAKFSEFKKGIATTGAKKPAKEEDKPLGSMRPKALFQESKGTTSCKRPSKSAKVRVVASRYNLAGTRAAGEEPGSKRRKWSLPELGREKTRGGSRRGSSGSAPECKRSQASELEDEMNFDLKIPDNLDVEANPPTLAQVSPSSILKVAEMLPKIKTLRCNTESPRDSGCAKRAADLVGRKSFFAMAEDEELNSHCQTLTFHEDE